MLSERLIFERKRKKLTQERVADYLGITRPAYTAYERGSRQPDYEILKKLAELYEVSTDYLLGRTDKRAEDDNVSSAFHDYDNITEEEKEYLDLQLEIFRKMKEERKKKRENK